MKAMLVNVLTSQVMSSPPRPLVRIWSSASQCRATQTERLSRSWLVFGRWAPVLLGRRAWNAKKQQHENRDHIERFYGGPRFNVNKTLWTFEGARNL